MMAAMKKGEALELLRGGEGGITEWNRKRDDGEQIPKLDAVNLRRIDLGEANLEGADFQGADLQDANLQDAVLSDANLEGANLEDADLDGAILLNAILIGVKTTDEGRTARSCACLTCCLRPTARAGDGKASTCRASWMSWTVSSAASCCSTRSTASARPS